MKNINFLNKIKKAYLRNSTTILANHLWLTFVKVLVWLYDIPSSEHTHVIKLLERIQSLRKNSGDSWTVAYLKEAHRLSSHWVSGKPDTCSSEVRVAVRGLPLIIPGPLRNRCYARENWNYFRVILTLLSVFRVMNANPKLKLGTITDSFTGVVKTLPTDAIYRALENLGSRRNFNLPSYKKETPYKGRLLNLSTAGPNSKVQMRGAMVDAIALTAHPLILQSLIKFAEHSTPYLASVLKKQSAFLRAIRDFPIEKFNRIGPILGDQAMEAKSLFEKIDQLKLGKLSTKQEAAGKVRVFAMVDIWTQSILAPLHDTIFDLLKTIPMDGTFDQLAPLKLMQQKGLKNLYSFDLSAATDRLPIDLQVQILATLVNEGYAKAWASILVDRDYHLSYQKDKYVLRYAVGQPMGALSSWGMLALTHHTIVQVAAQRAGVTGLFRDYALLGDDICIGDSLVAQQYLLIMRDLGVDINLSKSLISENSVSEFAKRWFIGDMDISPASPALITRFLTNVNYLPVLMLDLIERGVHTVLFDPATKLQSIPEKSGGKKFTLSPKIKFALLPYCSSEVTWLLPWMENSSLSPKDLYMLFELTDRVFNSIALKQNLHNKSQDESNWNKSTDILLKYGEKHLGLLPSDASYYDNLCIAKLNSSTTSALHRNFREKGISTANMTWDLYLEYLRESLTMLNSNGPSIPDIEATADRDANLAESKKVFDFMSKLHENLCSYAPQILTSMDLVTDKKLEKGSTPKKVRTKVVTEIGVTPDGFPKVTRRSIVY